MYMNVCVLGLWHQGSVTAACLAEMGHHVMGCDFDEAVIDALKQGHAPIAEPGLDELIQKHIEHKELNFTADLQTALKNIDVLWVAYDTPVDDDDNADVEFVTTRIEQALKIVPENTLVIISSQLPVGTTTRLMQNNERKNIYFAYSPENLRLGQAIQVFLQPDRFVVGVNDPLAKEKAHTLFYPLQCSIEWMSIASAEMTKHALNAFLAASVTFANEIAQLCEQLGADAKEVERGLKSDIRIGKRAYLSPGAAFAGGTLARDVQFLNGLSKTVLKKELPVLQGIFKSNQLHQHWHMNTLQRVLGSDLSACTIAIWGLTYKPGTDTLRRSTAVQLCKALAEKGVRIQTHDPVVSNLPADLQDKVTHFESPLDALKGAQALLVMTPWPLYRTMTVNDVVIPHSNLIVIDSSRVLSTEFMTEKNIRYFSVGTATGADKWHLL